MSLELTDKQEAILDATLELIGEHGFHGTPMSAIAKKADVGAGTIYRYYESKEELINALYLREKRAINAQLLLGVHDGLSAREAFGKIFRNGIEARLSNSARLRFLDQYYNSPFIGDDTRRQREQLMGEYMEIIERGVASGELRDLPRPLIMVMVFGPMMHLASAAHGVEFEINNELIELLLDTIWRSIGRE